MLKKNSFIPYGRQSIDQQDIAAIKKVLLTDWITQGPQVKKFENKLALFVKSKYALSVSSGTAALHLACLAAGIGSGDEVMVPTLSFVASANCVIYCGAKPVLVDVYSEDLTINVEEVEEKINKKTKAVIAVDFAGHPASWIKLRKLAKKYNLILIDDAAHAIGSKYKNKPIGTIADVTTFSFHPIKTITTGEGGAITTNSKEVYERLKMLRHHGFYKNTKLNKHHGAWYYQIDELGFNFRLTDMQAALGTSQLKKIDRFIKKRREIWQKYNLAFSDIEELILPIEQNGCYCAWHIYSIRLKGKYVKRRKQIFDFLRKAGIRVQVHYIPIHRFNYYKRKFGCQNKDFPIAEKYYASSLTLPMFVDLKQKDQNYIIGKVKEVLK